MGRTLRALVALAVSAIAVACALPTSGEAVGADAGRPAKDASTPIDQAAPDASPGDGDVVEAATPDASGPSDGAGVDAPPPIDGGSTVTIVDVGTVSNETGGAVGTHLVYATHAKLWWLFWLDSTQTQTIQTSYSADFVHWSPGGSLPLTLDLQGQGGNFSVAYADIGGADIVHLAIDAYAQTAPTRHHLHVRAVVSGSTITFGGIADMSDLEDTVDSDPDGPATYVDSLGNVWQATGWYDGTGGPGNEAIAEAMGADQGAATWSGTFGTLQNVYIATGTVHAHAFATAGTNLLVALCDAADTSAPTTSSSNVEWMTWGGAAWSGPTAVFSGGKTQAPNDWGVATMGNGHMHVARRATDGSFDHARYDGMVWTPLAAPAADSLGWATGQGVVVLARGNDVAIVTIAGDLANSVRMTVWNNGVSFGPWTTLEGSTVARGWVSGWSGAENNAVIWTEADGSGGYRIMGRVLSF